MTTTSNKDRGCCEKCKAGAWSPKSRLCEGNVWDCECHTSSNDMMEELTKRIIGITERGDDRDWEPQIQSILSSVISRTREETYKQGIDEVTEEIRPHIETARQEGREQGAREERERIHQKILSMKDLRDPKTQIHRIIDAHELVCWLQSLSDNTK